MNVFLRPPNPLSACLLWHRLRKPHLLLSTLLIPRSYLQLLLKWICLSSFHAASEPSSSYTISTSNGAAFTNMDNASNLTFDLDAYLDTSSCTISTNARYPVDNMHTSHQYDMTALLERTGAVHPGVSASLSVSPFVDRYVSPWPVS